jgi:hypothetical protein
MPSPKGIAFGQRRRTFKNGPGAARRSEKPPLHPRPPHFLALNKTYKAKKAANKSNMKKYVQSKAKSAPPAVYSFPSLKHFQELYNLELRGYNTRRITASLRANPHATASKLTRGLDLGQFLNPRQHKPLTKEQLEAAAEMNMTPEQMQAYLAMIGQA